MGKFLLTASLNLLILICVSAALFCFAEFGLHLAEAYFLREQVEKSERYIDLSSRRYNDPGVLREKPSEEFRVLSFGDSFAWGPVKYEYTYHAVAARELERALDFSKIRFVNLGEPSTSIYQYINAYEYWGKIIEHDAALFTVFLGNDLLEISFSHFPRTKKVEESLDSLDSSIQLRQRRSLIPHKYRFRIIDHLAALKHTFTNQKARESKVYHPFVTHLNPEAFITNSFNQLTNFDPRQAPSLIKGYEAVFELAKFVSGLRKSGKKVAIMLAPNETQVDQNLYEKTLRKFAGAQTKYDLALSAFLIREIFRRTDAEIPFIDLCAAFEAGLRRGDKLYFGRNTHWSDLGNSLAGHSLSQSLAKEWFSNPIEAPTRVTSLVNASYSPMNKQSWREEREELINSIVLPILGGSVGENQNISASYLQRFVRDDRVAKVSIDRINKINGLVGSKDNKVKIQRDQDGFVVSGWAIDEEIGDLASQVLLDINGSVFSTHYHLPRVDVAKKLGSSKFNNSGFFINIPNSKVSSGAGTMRLLVVSKDQSKYFSSRPIHFVLE